LSAAIKKLFYLTHVSKTNFKWLVFGSGFVPTLQRGRDKWPGYGTTTKHKL